MDNNKWKEWRLNALKELHGEVPEVEKTDELDESFNRLNKEAKLVVSLREMKRRLSEIEHLFNRTVESGKMDEATVDTWTNTYKSLKMLDERLHKLMDCMYEN